MLEKEIIAERIKSLPEESLREVADFIEFLEVKKEGDNPLTGVIGICEGPSDLAGRHDKYVYG